MLLLLVHRPIYSAYGKSQSHELQVCSLESYEQSSGQLSSICNLRKDVAAEPNYIAHAFGCSYSSQQSKVYGCLLSSRLVYSYSLDKRELVAITCFVLYMFPVTVVHSFQRVVCLATPSKQLRVDGSLAYSLSVQCGQNLRLFFLMKQIYCTL